jgi:hypothetical protein
MTEQTDNIKSLAPGDVFHATTTKGVGIICLAIEVEEEIIYARRICVPSMIKFNRNNGYGEFISEGIICNIDCTTPLPSDIYSIIINIEKKYRTETERERLIPTEEEKKAFVFVAEFYKED